MAKSLTCAKCGGPVEPHTGPGRPATYCSSTCKRLVEFELRRLDRRLGAYEAERRELVYEGPDDFDDEARQKRLRALRRWVAIDEARLRHLLGGTSKRVASGRINQRKSTGRLPHG